MGAKRAGALRGGGGGVGAQPRGLLGQARPAASGALSGDVGRGGRCQRSWGAELHHSLVVSGGPRAL